MKIYLIGFMGSGKTTIGKRLSSRLGFSFVDTDDLFTTLQGICVKNYFALYSEEKFREEEQKILYQTQNMDNVVVSLGGGTPCYQDNMRWILANGISVYIKMSAKALCNRLKNSKLERPLLPPDNLLERVESLLSQRENVYNMAHITVLGLDFDLEKLCEMIKNLN